MNLGDAILALDETADDLCIFAKRPWSSVAECLVRPLTAEHGVPEHIKAEGYEYFLEVSVAKEEALGASKALLTPEQSIAVVIYYAEYDAWPEWFNELCRSGRENVH